MTDEGLIACLVLASGMSRRYTNGNKLLADAGGESVVRRTLTAYVEAGLGDIWLVVGHDAENVTAALSGLPVKPIGNLAYREGQSRALAIGVASLPESVSAAVIGVADQPGLTAGVIRAIVDQYNRTRAPIVAPTFGSRRGNPVLFDRSLFKELLEVTGDQGGRSVIERYRDEVVWVEVGDERAGMDVDTVEDLVRMVLGF